MYAFDEKRKQILQAEELTELIQSKHLNSKLNRNGYNLEGSVYKMIGSPRNGDKGELGLSSSSDSFFSQLFNSSNSAGKSRLISFAVPHTPSECCD